MEGTSSSTTKVNRSHIPIDTLSKATTFMKNKTINIPYDDFELVMEQPVDFNALKANGFNVEKYFKVKNG
ncbi:hypothetical protein A2U01_0071560 [Trifolium medium]|uniref:Uncharacterized protein n=1 Tax=Trifolium medium TaxID=97028 RepID=A0A392SR41_9FABA|nr:hypothetical protein [Trifolium medium]